MKPIKQRLPIEKKEVLKLLVSESLHGCIGHLAISYKTTRANIVTSCLSTEIKYVEDSLTLIPSMYRYEPSKAIRIDIPASLKITLDEKAKYFGLDTSTFVRNILQGLAYQNYKGEKPK